MGKIKRYLILLGFLFILSGCTANQSIVKKKISAISNKQNISVTSNKQGSSSENKTISFKYFFRGFITLNYEQVKSYPHDTYIIETDEDWHDFMNKYVPGIPYLTSVDYSKECLVFSVGFPAKPSYSSGFDIKTFTLNKGKLEPEYIFSSTLGDSNGIYAQNINGIEHCFVNIVKINKKDIPKNSRNIYHKGDVFEN